MSVISQLQCICISQHVTLKSRVQHTTLVYYHSFLAAALDRHAKAMVNLLMRHSALNSQGAAHMQCVGSAVGRTKDSS
jgi:hypothetical protein